MQVPNNLGKLTNLRMLAIGHKLVKAIPEPVLQLTGLEELAITYCKLQRLPSNLAAMHRLRCLNLQGNPWLQAGSFARCTPSCPHIACMPRTKERPLHCMWYAVKRTCLTDACLHVFVFATVDSGGSCPCHNSGKSSSSLKGTRSAELCMQCHQCMSLG